ncbi:ribosomal large subunit pseudouridine synthase D [Anaerotignum neopropionicum]|uniref:RNA pseudouridylate synthase n=1 Tax=Anaerotignum neopropionicum TaxID=36847 RepID=A0A136WG05_9FIRM|nr:RluA family pseudouridine synthase [Anaerotignum neopropionicum]KXL53461.1 ribosomal large subunit pseudouridine synthase D [Anaerotignum neopropionicum]
MEWKILFEDETMLVVRKPQGMPTQADKTGDLDLLSALETYCEQSLGLIHRLDRPVGGLLVFAKTKVAETDLVKQMQEGFLEKRYRAVLCGKLPEKKGTLMDYLKKNMRTNLSEVVSSKDRMAKKSILHYEVLETLTEENQTLSYVEIQLETGRHHQIRVQTSHAGAPIWGDKKYNPQFQRRGQTEIALWAYALKGKHPITKKTWIFEEMPSEGAFRLFYGKR